MHIRKKILSKRDALPKSVHLSLSKKVAQNLRQLPQYSQCKLPLFFYSFKSEVDTVGLIKERLKKKQPVVLPKTLIVQRKLACYLIKSLDDLRPGAYSIFEPIPERCELVNPNNLDVVIVPGSVFDRNCARFGYGGGFYDRFLSEDAPGALRIALAFSFQVLDEDLPIMPHDEFMDFIVTDGEVIKCYDRRKKGTKQKDL